MLDLSPTGSALDTFHQRFQDDSLPRELSQAAFAAFDPSAYGAEELARGLAAWQLRALDEYRSQVAFTELLAELTEAGIAFDALGTCVRLVRDEARHVELCRRMVRALGGQPRIPGTPAWVRSDKRLSLQERIVDTVVGSLCIGETFSVRLLAAVREHTPDPLARALLTTLVVDESIHSRFGWTLLKLLWPELPAHEQGRLARAIPGWLSACEAMVLEQAGAVSGAGHPFGSLPGQVRTEVFRSTLERDVLGGFEALGVPLRPAPGPQGDDPTPPG